MSVMVVVVVVVVEICGGGDGDATMAWYGTTSTAISRNTDRPSAQKSYNIVIPSVVVNSSVGVIVGWWFRAFESSQYE